MPKPIVFIDNDAFAQDPESKEAKKLEAEGYLVVFVKPGAAHKLVYPPEVAKVKRRPTTKPKKKGKK